MQCLELGLIEILMNATFICYKKSCCRKIHKCRVVISWPCTNVAPNCEVTAKTKLLFLRRLNFHVFLTIVITFRYDHIAAIWRNSLLSINYNGIAPVEFSLVAPLS